MGGPRTRLVLTYLFMRMMREPQRYKDLQKVLDDELDDVGQNSLHASFRLSSCSISMQDEYPSHDAISRVPLLDAYINESLRVRKDPS